MMNTSEPACENRDRSCRFTHPALVSGSFASRIVSTAGIGGADTVLCIGEAGAAIETAVAGAGARALSITAPARPGKLTPSPFVKHARADVVLWAADDIRQSALTETLAAIGHHLRSGGRLVLWTLPGDCPKALACPEPIQRFLAEAGFTSVIAGPMTSDRGEVLVATGILNTGSKH